MGLVVLLLSLVALPLQLGGYITTCTMGDHDSAIAGAVFSAPFLVLALVLTLLSLRRSTAVRAFSVIGLAGAALVSSAMLFSTAFIWVNTLAYGSPCGEDYSGMFSSSLAARIVIVAGYLALPVANIAACVWLVFRAARGYFSG